LLRVAGAAQRVFALMDSLPDIDPNVGQMVRRQDMQGHLAFDAVEFTYQMRPDHPVIKGLSLDIPAGSTCALVGRSVSLRACLCALGICSCVSLRARYVLVGVCARLIWPLSVFCLCTFASFSTCLLLCVAVFVCWCVLMTRTRGRAHGRAHTRGQARVQWCTCSSASTTRRKGGCSWMVCPCKIGICDPFIDRCVYRGSLSLIADSLSYCRLSLCECWEAD